jgi:hypothetical protein
MPNEKVIMLIEAKIQPSRRAELVEAAREYLPLVRAEPGVEEFHITARKDDPNTFVFFEIYKSQAAGFPSPAGLHQEIPVYAKERAGRGPRADESPGAGTIRAGTIRAGVIRAGTIKSRAVRAEHSS